MISYNPKTVENVDVFNEALLRDSIAWQLNGTISENNCAITTQPLYTISGFWQEKFRSSTSELWCTNFGINSNTPASIVLRLDLRRAARIQDLKVQLTHNGQLIGNNIANLENPVHTNMAAGELTNPVNPAGDLSMYGGAADMWGLESFPNVSDTSFGVVVSFQSNIEYPHRDILFLHQLLLDVI